jgi:hypothetical protein
MDYKEYKKELDVIYNSLNEQVMKLAMAGFVPSIIICDPEGYLKLRTLFYSLKEMRYLQDGIFGLPPDSFVVKKVMFCDNVLTVMQRLGEEFKGVKVYAHVKDTG